MCLKLVEGSKKVVVPVSLVSSRDSHGRYHESRIPSEAKVYRPWFQFVPAHGMNQKNVEIIAESYEKH